MVDTSSLAPAADLAAVDVTETPAGAAPWWRSAVIYEVYVRSFADSNGDGEGDLQGLRSRLPYLRELGIDAVWLTPFYRSPLVDGGYDVQDYRDVDPRFGTVTDFDEMLRDAHEQGLRVIVDIVPNHSSSKHVWFQEALTAPPGSPARDRYIFRDGKGKGGELPPNDWQSIFGGNAWTRITEPDGTPGQWYLHLFDPGQPDLNWRNPEVRTEFDAILRFWLDRGVDGFRIDVAHGMIKAEGLPDVAAHTELLGTTETPYFDQDEVHEIYKEWRRVLQEYPGDRMAVAEAWVGRPERLARYVAHDELQQAFNFDYLMAPWSLDELRKVIDASLAATRLVGAPTTWVLSNHDRPRHVTRYGDGEVGRRRARAAIMLMLALPGSAYLYQGEELGLPEVLDLPEDRLQDPVWERSNHTDRGRDGCRVPLPWSGTAAPFGFGPAGSDPWLPQPAYFATLTAEAEDTDPESMLNLYRELLRLRREHPALGPSGESRTAGTGEVSWLDAPAGVLALRREPGFVCAVNFSDAPVEVPRYGQLIASSAELVDGVLPVDAAAWWSEG